MLKAIKALIAGARGTPTKHTAQPSMVVPAGYFMPASAEQLLNTASRKQCLQQLWENSALPKDLYEQFYLQPLKHLIALMQVLPATQQGEYAREGGLVDVTLQTATFTVRLAKGHMLPPGAAPENQSAQNVLWNAVVFYAALCWYLPLFNQLEGELQSGRVWLPGLTVPGEPYRFRFRGYPPENALTISQSAVIAARLVPAEAIDWLSKLPAAVQALMLVAARQPGSLPVIDDIVREAVRLARGNSLLPAIPLGDGPVAPTPMPSQAGTATADSLVPAVDLQSAVNLPALESSLAQTVARTDTEGQEGGGERTLADTLLSSALDEPVNKPLAEIVMVPETTANIGEDT